VYEITPQEKEAAEKALSLQQAARDAQQALRGLPQLDYRADDEAKEQHKATHRALAEASDTANTALNEYVKSADFLLYQLKTEANAYFAKTLPGGSLPALLSLAEETLATLDTETGERIKALARGAIVRMFNGAADPDINKARANVTATRYRSLMEAGIPEDLAEKIIVAEASVPWPTQSPASATLKR
jgi:hypothetical protein